MANAYTPGLTVSGDIVVHKVRRLPIKGEVLLKQGDQVTSDQVVARAMLPGALQTIKLAEQLGIEAKEVGEYFKLKQGDPIEKGELIAETKGIFGLFKSSVQSEYTGTVETISEITGHALIREPSIPVDVKAYIQGHISEILPEEGAIVETRGAMVQGIFGVGGERSGTIRVVTSGPDEVLDAQHVPDDAEGLILIGGSGITAEGLKKASQQGVAGLVVGGIRDSDLIEFLGYDIGVAITGQEAINLTVMVTEGFGYLAMAARTFELLKSLEGKVASINGATQIRAGVIRPEIIVPLQPDSSAQHTDEEVSELSIGTPIRIIREPYFGKLGTVTDLPSQLMVVDSGTEVRVLKAKLNDGSEVYVPRANVEIIAT